MFQTFKLSRKLASTTVHTTHILNTLLIQQHICLFFFIILQTEFVHTRHCTNIYSACIYLVIFGIPSILNTSTSCGCSKVVNWIAVSTICFNVFSHSHSHWHTAANICAYNSFYFLSKVIIKKTNICIRHPCAISVKWPSIKTTSTPHCPAAILFETM